jgi:maltose-binding protein MalE
VDLTEPVGSFSNLFDPYLLDRNMLLNSQTGKRALYGLPIAQTRNQLYVWKSLVEQAGFTLADIPKQWDAF